MDHIIFDALYHFFLLNTEYSYRRSILALHTPTQYSNTILTLNSHSILAHNTRTQYSHSILALHTHAQYSLSILAFHTLTQYSLSIILILSNAVLIRLLIIFSSSFLYILYSTPPTPSPGEPSVLAPPSRRLHTRTHKHPCLTQPPTPQLRSPLHHI